MDDKSELFHWCIGWGCDWIWNSRVVMEEFMREQSLDMKLGFAEGYAAAQAKYQKRTQELEWENRCQANYIEELEKKLKRVEIMDSEDI